ncbi:MAG TPA: 6-phosphofructokinase [Chloroflexi bacterium]|jgi:6-phosphofructokinase|nr:6-phosphofructokinase [Chloroflexota bacterium]
MPKKLVGVLTAGGDCPGLNAAIRAVGKAAHARGMDVIGFLDGFHGLVENRTVRLDMPRLSGILTLGGTILGTSRDKPHRMPVGGGQTMDMTSIAADHYNRLHLDALICMGGGGTQKNAYRLLREGLNIITLPKTIDNDVARTDITFGFDTAMATAAEAIDRLHSTADSHHRVMIVEIMGHNAGWLTLGAGIAGGADVILIPEIPYRIERVIDALVDRYRQGKRFSIVAIAEGALSVEEAEAPADGDKAPDASGDDEDVAGQETSSVRLVRRITDMTNLEARVTVLGHLQRGGTPTPTDRLLATRLGTAAIDFVEKEEYGVMVGIRGEDCVAVPLKKVAGQLKRVPLDHHWIRSARLVGTAFGD